jgi:hypothetical protein
LPDRWPDARYYLLLLAGLIVLSFPQVILGWETFVSRDYGLFAYPLAHYQRECFWRGELPLWNPYNNCGTPFLAQWNTMPLYPLSLIYLVFPLEWSLSFFCLLHLGLAGAGMFTLARRWTGSEIAGAFAGVVFAFNGLALNLLMWPSHIATYAWMPWVVFLMAKGLRKGGPWLLLPVFAGTMQMLAGGPELILFTWLLTGLVAVADWLKPDPETAGRPRLTLLARRFFLVILVVALLSAAQLLPFLDLVAHSQRSPGFADTRWSLPLRGWANFLVPMAFGSTWEQDIFYQYGQYWTSSYYLGVGTLALAILGIGWSRDKRVRWLGGATLVAVLLAFGDHAPLLPALRAVLPQISMVTYPIKFLLVLAFAVPLIAAFGLAESGRVPPTSRSRLPMALGWISGTLLLLIGVVLLWSRISPGPQDDFPAILRNGLGRAGALLLIFVVLAVRAKAQATRWRKPMTLLILVVVWLDFLNHEPTQNPTVTPAVYTPGMVRTELALDPKPALGVSRVMVSPAAQVLLDTVRTKDFKSGYLAKRLGFFSNCNLLDDVPKVNGFFSLSPREFDAFNQTLYSQTNLSFPKVYDFLSVSHETAPGEAVRWQPRTTFLPMVTAGQEPVFLDETNALRWLFSPSFKPGAQVALPLEAKTELGQISKAPARVALKRFGSSEVEFEVEASAPALAVVAQAYYHRWQADVDGIPARIWKANFAFQAVAVPAGRHQVRLVYEDRAFRVGAAISGITFLVCLVLLARWLRQGRKLGLRGGGGGPGET